MKSVSGVPAPDFRGLDGLAGLALGDGTHHPDSPDCNVGATFFYGLEQVATSVPPQITEVDPAELLTGADHSVWVYGAGFVDGATVAADSADVTVTAVTFIDESTLSVDLTVAADAAPGPVAVTVTNPNTLSDTLPAAVTLIAPAVDEPNSGCACTSSSSPSSNRTLLLWSLLLALGLCVGSLARQRKGGASLRIRINA